ncbi:hypothetical protein [Halomonas organivorans]|uniref:Phosphoglycerol transferase MdoB-like AlkP superfamily enzyme n=1 Tax=Halomonas organivorans TaxID=257772 RepID=A0A7W5BX15_9GAMM|nr:hypothetical protein [Halomonas organivorans]MBB3140741.1 phosphoglycerol transferase MdoB-like AlkP superfamily enzyme [Halomonas organivorans]
MGATSSPERLSLLVGLAVMMAATLPRYLAGGHQTRLTLIVMAIVAVLGVALAQWRLLAAEARVRLPALLRRLLACLALGLVAMAAWQLAVAGWGGWVLLASHGTTLGLLLHAVGLWWKPVAER